MLSQASIAQWRERLTAKDPRPVVDFVFDLDGKRHELTYDELKACLAGGQVAAPKRIPTEEEMNALLESFDEDTGLDGAYQAIRDFAASL